jgi:hypothetical protein
VQSCQKTPRHYFPLMPIKNILTLVGTCSNYQESGRAFECRAANKNNENLYIIRSQVMLARQVGKRDFYLPPFHCSIVPIATWQSSFCAIEHPATRSSIVDEFLPRKCQSLVLGKCSLHAKYLNGRETECFMMKCFPYCSKFFPLVSCTGK